MRLTSMQIQQGEMMPKWYGLAKYEPWSDTQIVYPIPLNLLYRWYDALRWKIKRGKESALSEAWADGYNEGRRIMYDVGFDRGVRHGKKIQADELRAGLKELGFDIDRLPRVSNETVETLEHRGEIWVRLADVHPMQDKIIALESKLSAADEAWHEQEDELQALRGKLDTARLALRDIMSRSNPQEWVFQRAHEALKDVGFPK